MLALWGRYLRLFSGTVFGWRMLVWLVGLRFLILFPLLCRRLALSLFVLPWAAEFTVLAGRTSAFLVCVRFFDLFVRFTWVTRHSHFMRSTRPSHYE